MGTHLRIIKHTIIKRSYYYYRRSVPAILQSEYIKNVILISSNTRCHKVAGELLTFTQNLRLTMFRFKLVNS